MYNYLYKFLYFRFRTNEINLSIDRSSTLMYIIIHTYIYNVILIIIIYFNIILLNKWGHVINFNKIYISDIYV